MMVYARDDSQRRFSSAKQRCNIVGTLFRIVTTLFQHRCSQNRLLLDRFLIRRREIPLLSIICQQHPHFTPCMLASEHP